MPGLKCALCDAEFFPVSEAWGHRMCGDCIAASIQLALDPDLLSSERKPARRATPVADGAGVEAPGRDQRAA